MEAPEGALRSPGQLRTPEHLAMTPKGCGPLPTVGVCIQDAPQTDLAVLSCQGVRDWGIHVMARQVGGPNALPRTPAETSSQWGHSSPRCKAGLSPGVLISETAHTMLSANELLCESAPFFMGACGFVSSEDFLSLGTMPGLG